jgi:hypothetical protein
MTSWDNFGQAISNYNNQMITLSELPFTLNETSFREWNCLNLLQYPIDIIIRDSNELGPLY